MSLLGELLEFVEVRKGTDDSLETELRRETLCLLRRAHVESQVELVKQTRSCKDAAEDGAPDVAWSTSEKRVL